MDMSASSVQMFTSCMLRYLYHIIFCHQSFIGLSSQSKCLQIQWELAPWEVYGKLFLYIKVTKVVKLFLFLGGHVKINHRHSLDVA